MKKKERMNFLTYLMWIFLIILVITFVFVCIISNPYPERFCNTKFDSHLKDYNPNVINNYKITQIECKQPNGITNIYSVKFVEQIEKREIIDKWTGEIKKSEIVTTKRFVLNN